MSSLNFHEENPCVVLVMVVCIAYITVIGHGEARMRLNQLQLWVNSARTLILIIDIPRVDATTRLHVIRCSKVMLRN